MPPSQLKQLKASLQAQKGQKRKRQAPPKETNIDRSQKLRAQTLLPELQRRHKVGGILDRRIGENDPHLAPEDRALQRFTREATRRKKESVFNLENDDDEEEMELTHGGQALDLLGPVRRGRDDFDESGLGLSDDEMEDDEPRKEPLLKRVRLEDLEADANGEAVVEGPVVKRTHKEIMQEVVAKSKMYKHARQEQKEDDDDIREELDKGLGDLLAALRGKPPPPPKPDTSIHPDRLAILNGQPKPDASKEYDKRLRQLALDKRAQPTERTKTDEEKAAEEADRLKKLENKRLRRMKGEEVSDDEDDRKGRKGDKHGDDEDRSGDEDEVDAEVDEAADFGIEAAPVKRAQDFDVEDEDDFIIDDDLVASGSDIGDMSGSDEDESEGEDANEDDDADFLQDILPDAAKQGIANPKAAAPSDKPKSTPLAYTYPCPQTHEELLDVVKGVPFLELPTVVQRIRALYHPQLHASNKAKLGAFAAALIDHLSYIATSKPPFVVMESLIRHIHSMCKTFPDEIAVSFRSHLQQMHDEGTFDLGDLVLLTGISTIYPTSDHFHQVVTPAMTIMARWLELTTPSTPSDHLTGAYVVALVARYQRLSKRYVPEAIRFSSAALQATPAPPATTLSAHLQNLGSLMKLWADLPAFSEIFTPEILPLLQSLCTTTSSNSTATTTATATLRKLQILLSQARLGRRPLQLHQHRPLPIKTSAPKFEDNFNPHKHYEPDRERAEASKLRAEYKREKKGALRELKKDSGFLAREKLKGKKAADKAYEAKQRRLIAEIQGEEGAEKNKYERDKARRKGKF